MCVKFGLDNEILNETMKEAGEVYLKTVPMEAEVVIADSWAEK